MKCDACGAPVENGKCTYCGKTFNSEPKTSNNGPQINQTTIINNIHTSSHYSAPNNKKKKGLGCGTLILIFLLLGALGSCVGGKSDNSSSSSEEENKSVWAEKVTPIDNFEYYIDGDEIYLKDYNGYDKKIRIASTYTIEDATYNVVSLDATFALERVNSVIVPEGVRAVSNNVFNSSGIEFVYIPSTLEEINTSFLSYFHDVEKIYYGGSEELWNEKVDCERGDIDAKQIIFDANPDDLQ